MRIGFLNYALSNCKRLYGMPVLSCSPFTLHPHYPREEYVVLQMDVLVKVLFELHENRLL